jgi:hypothetical protein
MRYATITKQSTTFTVVAVQLSVFQNEMDTERALSDYSYLFPGMPIVLMAPDPRGTPIYVGRIDIVNSLRTTDPSAIPWQTYHQDRNSFQTGRDSHRLIRLAV